MSNKRRRKRKPGQALARRIDREMDRQTRRRLDHWVEDYRKGLAPEGHVLLNLGPRALGLLAQLHEQGLYGVTVEDTAESLILEGLRARLGPSGQIRL